MGGRSEEVIAVRQEISKKIIRVDNLSCRMKSQDFRLVSEALDALW